MSKKYIHSYTVEFHVYSDEFNPSDVPVDTLVQECITQLNVLNDEDTLNRIDCFDSINNPDV